MTIKERVVARPFDKVYRAGVLVALVALAATISVSLETRAQPATAGLTGIDRADDVILARQTLMDGVETEMMALESALGGKQPDLATLKSRAYMIYTLITAFPHLFPPETKPVVAKDGTPSATAALPVVWAEFDAFYDRVQAGASAAFDASQAGQVDQYRGAAKKLREACDGCHEKYMQPTASAPK